MKYAITTLQATVRSLRSQLEARVLEAQDAFLEVERAGERVTEAEQGLRLLEAARA